MGTFNSKIKARNIAAEGIKIIEILFIHCGLLVQIVELILIRII